MADFGVFRPDQAVPIDVLGQFNRGYETGQKVRKVYGARKVAEALSELPDPSEMYEEPAQPAAPGAIPTGGAAPAPKRRAMTAQDWADIRAKGAKTIGRWGTSDDIEKFNQQVDERKLAGFNDLSNRALMAFDSGDMESAKRYVEGAYGFFADGQSPSAVIETDPKTGQPGIKVYSTSEETGERTGDGMFVTPKMIQDIQARFGGDVYKFRALQVDEAKAASDIELQKARADEINGMFDTRKELLTAKVNLTDAQWEQIEENVRQSKDLYTLNKQELEAQIDLATARATGVRAAAGVAGMDKAIKEFELGQAEEWDDVERSLGVADAQSKLGKVGAEIELMRRKGDYYTEAAAAERNQYLKQKYTGLTEESRYTQMNQMRENLKQEYMDLNMVVGDAKDVASLTPFQRSAYDSALARIGQYKMELDHLDTLEIDPTITTQMPVGATEALPTGATEAVPTGASQESARATEIKAQADQYLGIQ